VETKKTLTLKEPVEFGGKTYTSLDLKEPTAKQLAKAMEYENSTEQQIILVAETAQVPPGLVELITMRDIMEAGRFFEGFMQPGAAATGKT
jgi:hypothetical protein